MLCAKCQKNPATVRIQQFTSNGVKSELHLCQECTFKLDNPEMLASFENMFKGIMEQMGTDLFSNATAAMGMNVKVAPKANVSCIHCGMSYSEFKSIGKLGCATCYQSFEKEVRQLLKTVQGSLRHEGKYPRRLGAVLQTERQIIELRASLQKAIAEENFEEAAKLRDEIRAFDTSTDAGTQEVTS
ncbi:MAG: UvrB/UvrC motif-containing protein [Defluviitaleaceae bacterium]|nr:UvrB/UvrC motif-containing protein [Defluviitaleaceae bacterium]